MRFTKTFYILLIAFILLNLTIIYATNSNYTNYKNIFRIHVVANSDSIDDQLLKYTIAKKVDKYISHITSSSTSKEESKLIIKENLSNILNICNLTIKDNGFNYDIKAYLGKIMYDEKHKNNISMNAGIYDSLKIVIGNGNGENWWSLIYPTNIDVELMNTSTEDTTFSLGIVEFFKNLFI